ncbi:O-antigen ligase family protein [Stenotrophomonas mori]|uniref:O-antigen ligase family protein n=1 Tax=Stenotrophomonas mori TaxID=2871096 RepID=A0ABT0SJB6_9GAMM|nr:O-antigen ligase family protein [Stenotrophomonas mori]MCL7715428.1 O-antigen ligase family protein [Stenotrophomonas mori]
MSPPFPAASKTLALPWRNLLFVGLVVLVAGMCFLPAGPSFNPGKPFQAVVALLLYLPALIAALACPARLRAFACRPLMPLLLLLFAWAALSVAWSNSHRPHDEFLRLLTVLLFLFACTQGVGDDLARQRRLLVAGAGVLTLAAIAAMAQFAIRPTADNRLIGFGVMANANLFGAAMGAGILWLWPWRFQNANQRTLKWLAMTAMAVALVLTFSRSAMLAVAVSLFVMLVIRQRERAVQRLLWLCVVAVGLTMAAYPELSQRGLSLRPQLFARAMELVHAHPWLGMGLGAEFALPVVGGNGYYQVHTHNLFTQLAVELGIPGVVLWSAIWLGLGVRAWRHRDLAVGRVVLGLWLFATVLVQFDLPHLIDSPRPGWLFLWLPLALSLSLPRPGPRFPAPA